MKSVTWALPAGAARRARAALLAGGMVSSLLYVAGDLLAATRSERYQIADQAISELMAIGAPTRPLLLVLFSLYDLLIVGFGLGVLASASGSRALRAAGWLILLWAAVGFAGLVFVPMHPRGSQSSLTDVMHVADAAVLVALILLAMGFAAAALGRAFRFYTFATMAILLAFGAISGMQGPRLAANLPTPWMGVTERINVYSTMLWVLVLAVTLLRAHRVNQP